MRIQALLLCAAHEALDVRRQIRRPRRQAHCLNPALLQRDPKRLGELRVTIHQQVLLPAQESAFGIGEVSRNLEHPSFIRIGRETGEVHPPRCLLHEEQQID